MRRLLLLLVLASSPAWAIDGPGFRSTPSLTAIGGPGLSANNTFLGTNTFSAVLLTQDDLETTQGKKLTFDGATAAKYLSSNGTYLSLTGLDFTVPSNGKVCFNGTTCTRYMQYNSTDNRLYVVFTASEYLSMSHPLELVQTSILLFGTTAQTGINNTWTGAPVPITDAEGLVIMPQTLATCASALEGTMVTDAAAGGTSGHRTRLCMCTSDGGGSPVYKWQNVVSGTLGTTTTCAD